MNELCKGCLNYLHCPLKRDLRLPACRYYSSIMEFTQKMDDVDPSDWNSFDYDGEDIGTATVKEMRLQNGDY